MKTRIHPTPDADAVVRCTNCGTEFQTRPTQKDIHVEPARHVTPSHTGRNKAAAVGGRIDTRRRDGPRTRWPPTKTATTATATVTLDAQLD
jgi:large subunit ribosomal protein L31